jgi:cation diffusion facilitator CzcD-associated flavoprotein CzcO
MTVHTPVTDFPHTPDHEVAIVGSGFSGLGMAIRLKQSGEDSFVVLEQAGAIGGTWRDNTYPGCSCDVQSHLYSFSFEPNPSWSRLFAPQSEIRDYLEHCTDKYGVRHHVRLNAEVTRAEFDETAGLWRIEVNDGAEVVTARAIVAGIGGLSRPAYPQIDGLERFRGTAFHSAEWDHGYDFRGKRVAVIGTGASAIQFVPQLAREVEQLDLYQRTPPWIVPKPDRRTTRLERGLFARLPGLQQAYRSSIYWRLETRVLGFTVHPRLMKVAEWVARAHIRRQVKDPELRRKVTPDYTIGCKRILISNDYYPSLNRLNVNVLTDGLERVTEGGVVTRDGVERPVDAIVFGTGFKVNELLTPLSIVGRDGVDINDAWRDGMEAYLGTTVSGFPNLFMLTGPNTGLGHSSIVYMIESQVHYVLEALRTMRERRLRWVDVRPGVQSRYNTTLQSRLDSAVWSSGCKSWYVDATGRNRTLWPGFTFKFREATGEFLMADYECAPAHAPVLAEAA